MPNSLRFKVRRNSTGKLYGVIFHMPCKPPEAFGPNDKVLRSVWTKVHHYLDGCKDLKRSAL